MHPFRTYIERFTRLSEEEWEAIESCLTRREYPAGQSLLEDGQVCRKLYFVEQGLLRFFVYKDGLDASKFFTVAPYCFTSQKSFTEQMPSRDNIETLEDSVIWELSRADAFALFRYPNWSEFVRKLIQEVQFNTEQLLEASQNQTAEERYISFLETEGQLLTRLPLKHVASFLGIAPQSLSRIRKRYVAAQRKLT